MEKYKEHELLNLIKNGDRSAMADLYRLYIGFLTALCSRYIIDREEMKDTLQNSFIKIFSSLDRFQYRGPGSLKAWMSRIVVNESLKTLYGHQKDNKFKEDFKADLQESEDDIPQTDDIPAHIIQEMIKELPDGYRTVFNLFVFEEMSHREIAEILGITESTSASQFHRARNILAKKIKDYRNRETS